MFFFSYFFVFTCIQAGGAVFSGYKKRMYQTRIFFCFDTSSLLWCENSIRQLCLSGSYHLLCKDVSFHFPVCADSDWFLEMSRKFAGSIISHCYLSTFTRFDGLFRILGNSTSARCDRLMDDQGTVSRIFEFENASNFRARLREWTEVMCCFLKGYFCFSLRLPYGCVCG